MANIKFIDRKEELQKLNELKRRNFFLVVKGRRRIGKTMLLRHAFPEAIYIFIWPDKSLDWMINQICSEYGLPQFRNFKDIIEYLLDKEKIIILDEFQNFLNIDRSVYGEIQKMIDERKMKEKFLKIAAAGSSYSLMNKVFDSVAFPLYGRRTDEIKLDNIPPEYIINELNMPISDCIKLWSVFEGVPYYYELIEKKNSAEENIKRLIVSKEAQLQEEGKALLSIEFGRDSKTYNTILTGIAEGKTKLNELASLFNNKKNEVVKYLDILRKEFNIVRKMTPITENPSKSKEGRYEIIDNFLLFWFKFYENLRNYREQERFDEIIGFLNKNFNSYVGKKFEKFIISLIKSRLILKDIRFTKIGNQWGKCIDNPKETYEIDILALDEKKNEALFGECKWSDSVSAEKILSSLSEKTKNVSWNKESRKESFVIFAKSFKTKLSIWEGKKVYCINLKDIEKALRIP